MRYVEMSEANSMHSDPMNAQIATLRWSRPVVVGGWAWVMAAVVIWNREERESGAGREMARGLVSSPLSPLHSRLVFRLQRLRQPPIQEERHQRGEADDAGDGEMQVILVDQQQAPEHQREEQRHEQR